MKQKKGFTEGYKTYDTSNGYGSPEDWRKALKDRINQNEEGDEDYKLLDVLQNVSDKSLKMAYRKKMRQWHPDNNPDNIEEAVAMSQSIISAYERIKAMRGIK